MPGQLENLYKLKKADLPRAGLVLADAFQHDPVWTKFFEGVDKNDLQMGAWYESAIRHCHRYGDVYAPSEHLEGIAGWVPGDLAEMTFWRMIRSGAFKSGMKMGWSMAGHAQKMRGVFGPIDADRRATMKGRAYIYLLIIGVASEFQGQGFGGKLFGALIEKSEQDGVPIYLETETETNVRMYEKLGFRLVKQVTLPVINLPLWEMLRETKK